MAKKLSAKVNASYAGSFTYLNVGKEASLRVPTASFKELPAPGSVCDIQFDGAGRLKFKDGTLSNYMVAKGFKVLGVKPAGEFLDDFDSVADYEPQQAPAPTDGDAPF